MISLFYTMKICGNEYIHCRLCKSSSGITSNHSVSGSFNLINTLDLKEKKCMYLKVNNQSGLSFTKITKSINTDNKGM